MGIRAFFRELSFPPHVWRIELDGPAVRVPKGRVTNQFLKDIVRSLNENEVAKGIVFGVQRPYGIQIEFSKDIPADCHQKLRNIWQLHRP